MIDLCDRPNRQCLRASWMHGSKRTSTAIVSTGRQGPVREQMTTARGARSMSQSPAGVTYWDTPGAEDAAWEAVECQSDPVSLGPGLQVIINYQLKRVWNHLHLTVSQVKQWHPHGLAKHNAMNPISWASVECKSWNTMHIWVYRGYRLFYRAAQKAVECKLSFHNGTVQPQSWNGMTYGLALDLQHGHGSYHDASHLRSSSWLVEQAANVDTTGPEVSQSWPQWRRVATATPDWRCERTTPEFWESHLPVNA